ncbi:MAG: hypothetical protein M0P95_12900 [Sulfuritalea sp.]|nr:hypothetical protein [Sulfuritalea sp.]
MFEFFTRKFSRNDSVSLCATLAKNASIDAVMESGNYCGFLIVIDADGASLAPHFKYPEARTAFISAVEGRLKNGEYQDPGDGLDMVMEMRELSGWKPNFNVGRAVIGRGNKPLFNWNP